MKMQSTYRTYQTNGTWVIDDITPDDLWQRYFVDHQQCALCGIPYNDTGMHRSMAGLQLAHIIGGSYRVMQPWDVLMLCEACHRAHHNSRTKVGDVTWGNVTTPILLAVKFELRELNVPMLSTLWGRTPRYIRDLARTPIPEFFLKERDKWTRKGC